MVQIMQIKKRGLFRTQNVYKIFIDILTKKAYNF